MTKYMGGKARVGAEIADVLARLDPAGPHQSPYWEPFVGMCGVMRHMQSPTRIGSDLHGDVIEMWKAVQNGWVPPFRCTKQQYEKTKQSLRDPHLRGFLGHAMSFKGIYFGSYFDTDGDRCALGCRNVMECEPSIRNVDFFTSSYDNVQVPPSPSLLIYCDPPYLGTDARIGKRTEFDHDAFWNWVRQQSKFHAVVVSERTAPPDFIPVWESGEKTPQYLYMHKSQRALYAPLRL